jgi:hypothetical protein
VSTTDKVSVVFSVIAIVISLASIRRGRKLAEKAARRMGQCP